MTTFKGTIERLDTDHCTLRFERRLPATIERVWAALTDSAELAGWLSDSSVDLRPGGAIEHDFDPGDESSRVHGTILIVEPPTTFEYEWRFEGEADSILRYDLAPDGDATTLTLTHRLLGTGQAAGYGAGWHAYLDMLEAVLSGAEPPDWGARYSQRLPEYSNICRNQMSQLRRSSTGCRSRRSDRTRH